MTDNTEFAGTLKPVIELGNSHNASNEGYASQNILRAKNLYGFKGVHFDIEPDNGGEPPKPDDKQQPKDVDFHKGYAKGQEKARKDIYAELGLSSDEDIKSLVELRKQEEERKNKQLLEEKKFQELLEKQKAEHEARLKAKDENIQAYSQQINNIAVAKEITALAAKHNAHDVQAIEAILKAQYNMSYDITNSKVSIVNQATGQQAIDGNGNNQTLDGLVEMLKKDKPYLFKETRQGGAGSNISNGNGKNSKPAVEWTAEEIAKDPVGYNIAIGDN
jgi:hypothetical protein